MLSRRLIIKALALVSIGVGASLLTSCQVATEETEETGGVNLSLLEWNGYQQAEYHPEYNAKYGGQPQFTFFADEQDALQRMRTGYQVDLVHLCAGRIPTARDAGLIKPLDIHRIPRWGEITPTLLEVRGVQADGKYWIAPWDWGYSTVAYNPEVIDVENATYDIFIDPRFRGKTALTSDLDSNLLIAGIIGEWADPLDPTEAEMEAAPEIFTKMLENARFVWTDGTQLEQAWAAGDVGISYVFGSASRRMKEEGLPIVVVDPLMPFMCGLSLTANGPGSEDQAYDYINAMLDPASGVALFNVYGYGHGNANTVNLIDPARVVGTGIDDPVGTFARGVFTYSLPPAKKARLFQLWFEAQAGLD
jgi:spermidine/putrescine-binding protein